MSENKRSDPPLFEFCTSLKAGTPEEKPFEQALWEARQLFPCKPGMADFTLCVPHRLRMEINRKQNESKKTDEAVLYKAPAARRGENSAQDMWVYPGQTLIGAGRQVRKGVFVTVKSADDKGLVLETGVKLTPLAAVKCLRLAHAITVASSQGLTLGGRVRVIAHDTMDTRSLYVACSRATAAGLLEVC